MSSKSDNEKELYRKMFGRPNFILIHTDQQRADCIGAYGRREWMYTPCQDSIAAMGAKFNACYAACPVCIPQRLSLLTGQSPQRHGVRENIGIPDLELDSTFPMEMHRGGYHTALVGRTMHTYPFTNPYGFDEYEPGDPSNNEKDKDCFFQFIEKCAPEESGGYNGNGTCNNSRLAAPFHLENRFHQTMWATNRALEFLDRQREKTTPFFLCVGYYAPHSPLNPPKEWMDYYMNMDLKEEAVIAPYDVRPVSNGNMISPYVDLRGEELRRVRAAYYANISFIDTQIARIFDRILMMPNTYVIFTSDHGEMLGDHYHMHKGMPFQGAVHTPFLICGPGIEGRQVIDAPFAWQDIMPTVLELADLPVPESVDGRSFAKLLLGETKAAPRQYLHGEGVLSKVRFHGYEGQEKQDNLAFEDGFHYLTDGKMKYIWYNRSGREQLFDLQTDYEEKCDLSKDASYQKELDQWRKRLILKLADREEGFSDGKELHCAAEPPLSGIMQKICDKKIAEGKKVAYYYPGKKHR